MSAKNHFCVVETHKTKLKFFGGVSGGDEEVKHVWRTERT